MRLIVQHAMTMRFLCDLFVELGGDRVRGPGLELPPQPALRVLGQQVGRQQLPRLTLGAHLQRGHHVEAQAHQVGQVLLGQRLRVQVGVDQAQAAEVGPAAAQAADEAFVTSASTFVMPVVEIDGVLLGDGVPGRVAPRLREIYLEESRKAAI